MARYRIVEVRPSVYHVQEKKFLRGWLLQGVALSMNEADEKLNEVRRDKQLIPGYPRVIREVSD